MTIQASKMDEARTTIEVEWFGEVAEVEIRPGKLNRDLIGMMDSNPGWEGLAEQVKALVVRWELVDDAAEELPVNDETIATLPFGFIRALVFGAIESVSAEGKPSSGTS